METTPQPVSAETETAGPPSGDARFAPLETRIYRASPLGLAGTTLAIFLLVYGSYVAIAQLSQSPPVLIPDASGRLVVTRVAWIAFILSLIFTGGIAFAESGRRLWRREAGALAAALQPDGAAAAAAPAQGIPAGWRRRYDIAFYTGAATGLVSSLIPFFAGGYTPGEYLTSIGLWFLVVSPLLYGLAFRAGVDAARESQEIGALVRQHLVIDLFHLDRLGVFGRIGLRSALSWMIMAAILLLFLINPARPDGLLATDQLWVAIPAIVGAMLGGAFLLVSAVHPVHVRIRAAKRAELDRVHARMAMARDRAMDGDAAAASALAGYTDYETWLDARPEWPLSQGVATRFSFYVLIPVIPIIGSYVFEKLADRIVAGGGV